MNAKRRSQRGCLGGNCRNVTRHDSGMCQGCRELASLPFSGSMAELKAANRAADLHWFDPATLRFFRSRVGEIIGSGYFVSSEQGPDGVRRYTVRRGMADGSVDTVGEFQAHATRARALAAIRCLLED